MIFSNRKLKMIIIIILLMIFCYFIGIYKPKALVYSEYIANETSSVRDYQVDVTGKEYTVNFERTVFNNKGNGHVIFNIVQAPLQSTNNVVYTMRLGGYQTYYTCSVSGGTWYVDNGEQRLIQTVDCPYNSNYDNGARYLTLMRDSNYGTSRVYVPLLFTFISGEDSSAVVDGLDDLASQLISNNNTNTQSILASLSSIWTKTETNTQSILDRLDAIKTLITNNSSAITNIQNNTQNINDSINDSSIDDSSSSTSGFSNTTNGSMSNTPVSNLIALPITFLTGVNNAISSSCTNVNYIELFNYQLVLPCLNLSERLGNVWVIIDTIVSCMLLFSIGKSLVSTFARLSDMDTNIMYECYANGKDHRGESF